MHTTNITKIVFLKKITQLRLLGAFYDKTIPSSFAERPSTSELQIPIHILLEVKSLLKNSHGSPQNKGMLFHLYFSYVGNKPQCE